MNEGKVAIVTGGVTGLGRAVVERLSSKGVRIAIVGITEELGRETERSLQEQGRSVVYYDGDVADEEAVSRVVSEIYRDFGRIDYLVNAAGIITRAPAKSVQKDDYQRVLSINLVGGLLMCQAVYPYMAKDGGGSIVNFGSMLAHYGSKNLISYASSKGAVIQMTKCLAVDWAEDNIRVNAVSPGYIETQLSAGATKDPVFKERILSRTPQRRFGRPEEVAAVIDFLLSEDASFVTGVDIPIDGGLLAGDPVLYPPAAQS